MQILDVCKGPIVPQWQKAAHWTSAIHSHALKAQSYNADWCPILTYLRYSMNYTTLFIFDWTKLKKNRKTAVLTTEGSSMGFCNSSGNSF